MGAAVTWLAAGLCAGAPETAPTVDLDVSVQLDDRRLEAEATYRLPAGAQRLRWHPSLELHEALLDGRPLALRGNVLALELATPGELRLEWGLDLSALDQGIDHRTVLGADTPMAGHGFAWLPAAAGWQPLPDAGLSGFELVVRSDAREAIAAGDLVEVAPAAPTMVRQFVHRHPVAGIDLLVGPWQVQSRRVALASGGTAEVATYFTQAIAELADGYLESASAQLRDYDALIGAYPFSRFAIVASPLPTGFGMPGMTWLGEQVLRLPFIRSTSLRHEVLHNWWGNGVRVDYARGNWSEGLTTLMADFAAKEAEGPAAAAGQRLDWVRSLLAVPAGEVVALRDFRSREHGRLAAVGYGKAAFLLWMLRERIGPEAWQGGLRAFWDACRDRTAAWEDLQAAFESVSGKSLDDAFHPWLEARALPAPRIVAAQRLAGAGALAVTLAQDAPLHNLDLPLLVRTEQGIESHRVHLGGPRETFRLTTRATALAVTLDPELTVLRSPPAGAVPPILRNALLARRPIWQLAGAGEEWAAAAAALAARFFERPAVSLDADQPPPADVDARLIAGPAPAVAGVAEALGVSAQRPAALDGEGDGRVWTARDPGSIATLVFVEAEDAASLAAMARPLPHHGAAGWLLFAGGRVVARGAGAFAEPEFPVAPAVEIHTAR